jgi:hypothetical protein
MNDKELGIRNEEAPTKLALGETNLYTLMPLVTFKGLLGIDDREDKLAAFSLVTSTFSIEQFCKRRLLRKKYFETVEFCGDLLLPLREYPVTDVLAVYTMSNEQLAISNDKKKKGCGEILEREFYRLIPDCESGLDVPYSIELSPALLRYRGLSTVKVVYWAGYGKDIIPDDLRAACMELAAWNFNRYRGKRIGMTGNIKGAGKEGEHFEMSMPENVRGLLEAYRRKLI